MINEKEIANLMIIRKETDGDCVELRDGNSKGRSSTDENEGQGDDSELTNNDCSLTSS